MALVVSDRVKEITTSTGTGAITLAGAQSNFVAFSAVLSDGDTTFYAIVDNNNLAWETGVGTYASAGNTLTRTTVLDSSNAGSLVNLQAGQKDVFVTNPATQAVYLDANDKIAGDQTFSGTVTLNADPASGLQAATKQYVDTIAAAGLHYHDPVRVEKEGNLSATYNNGSSGVGATLTNNSTQEALVIDGVTLSLNDRVLVYEQTDATQNGIYTVTDTGSVSTNWVLTRATDADTYAPSDPDSFGEGDAFYVLEGTLGAGEMYVMNTSGTITFGTTNITFAQISSAQIYTGGTGINITGSVISSDATLAEVTSNGASTTDALTLAGITVSSFAMGSAYSLPTSDGTTGQFLQTNGAGTVTFATASVPTLDAVTGAGNNTANSITVGNINASDVSCNALTSTGIDDNATSTAITIDSSQNVGIGTASPSEKLNVSGNILATGTVTASGGNSSNWNTAYGWGDHASAGYALSNGTNATGTWGISISGNAATSSTFSTGRSNYKGTTDGSVAGQLMWKEYGNNHTIFDASDSTTPSGTSCNNTDPTYSWSATFPTLMGWNGSSTYGVRVDRANTSENCLRIPLATGNYGTIKVNDDRGVTWAGYAIRDDWVFMSNGTGQSGIYDDTNNRWAIEWKNTTETKVTGYLTCTGNITAYSDERLKSDVETLDGSKVYEMRGVSFTKDGAAGSGVIAQELQKVAPELVIEGDEYLSVAYGNLVGYLIEAVKELKAEIEELKNGSSY